MQVDRILYPVTTLGPGNRVAIWTIGCEHHCEKCSNPELWDPDASRNIDIEEIVAFIAKIDGDIDGITITGGEPFIQGDELFDLVDLLKQRFSLDILVYSGFEFYELKNRYRDRINTIDVVITGKYVDDLNDNIGIRGSSNQEIHINNEKMIEKYKYADACERKSQNFYCNGVAVSAGIPVKFFE